MRVCDPTFPPSVGTLEVGANVELIGEQGVYLVVRVDRRRHCADLMLMGSNARMEFGIHLSAIRQIKRGVGNRE